MLRNGFMTVAVLALLSTATPVLATESATGSQQPAQPVAITEVQAKLFFSNTGRFSSNIFEKKDLVLHNVIIGEGGVEGPSETTLLIVTVTGTPKASVDGLKLRVTAKTDTRTLLTQECEVGIFNGNGNWYAPFLLYDTGCEPVKFSATLAVGAESQVVDGSIPFSCSE
jgi:hypothetical protein